MRSGLNNFNCFSENKLTKLANFVQFKRMLMFYLENWGLSLCAPPLSTPRAGCGNNVVKQKRTIFVFVFFQLVKRVWLLTLLVGASVQSVRVMLIMA